MFPTSDTIWWFGQSIGDTRSTAARTALPVPSATIVGFPVRKRRFEDVSSPLGNPGGRKRRGGVGWHHFAVDQVKQLFQLRRQLHTGRDRMLEPEGNQAFGETERNQTLGRCARDLQHLGDFVLGVTGNEIEPACPRGFVQT